MARTVESLIRANIHDIFGERDGEKRRAKIASLWAEDGVFIVPEGRFNGHSDIDVQSQSGVGMVPWAFGPPGAEPVLTGAVYVFHDTPKK